MIRYIGTKEDRAKIKELLTKRCKVWEHERLMALKMGFEKHNSLKKIAETVGRHPITIHRWFNCYRKAGLKGLLKRKFAGGYYKNRCCGKVKAYLSAGLKAKRWKSAVQAQQALQQYFGRKFNYITVWRWLKNCDGGVSVRRPMYEKKNPQLSKVSKSEGAKERQGNAGEWSLT